MQLINLCEGESIPHRLLLIDGVTSIDSDIDVVNQSLDCCATSKTIVKRFRVLIALLEGENILEVTNRSTGEISRFLINYKPVEFAQHVHLLYAVSSDALLVNQHRLTTKIKLGVELLQLMIAEEIRRRFNHRLTFKWICHNEIDKLYCGWSGEQFQTKSSQEIFRHVLDRIVAPGPLDSNKKYLVFMDESITGSRTDLNLGVGDVALVGIPFFNWPERWNDVQRVMSENADCLPNQELFAVGLGATLHEEILFCMNEVSGIERLCHTFNLAHTKGGIMDVDYANLHTRFIGVKDDPQNHRTCCFAESSLIVLRHHPWLNGSLNSTIAKIEFENGCLCSSDDIIYAELRMNNHTRAYWHFALHPVKLWQLPDHARELIRNENDSLFVLSAGGSTKTFRLDTLK